RRQVREAPMGPDFVGVAPACFDAYVRVRAIPNRLQRPMLVAELAVARFVRAVLPRLARIDEGALKLRGLQPAQDGGRREFRPVVRAQKLWRPMHAHELRQDLDHAAGPDPAATSIARHSRVNSSMTVRHFKIRPSAQVSNTKS